MMLKLADHETLRAVMDKLDRETCDVDRTVCDARVNKAVAAELRAMAELIRECAREDSGESPYDVLCDRADELDPPPPEPSSPRTAVREFHGRMPK